MLIRLRGAAPAAPLVIAMIVVAATLTAVAVIRVSRQHEVLRAGYELKQRSEQVQRLREAQRQLQLERATLTAPDRIRRLATTLGMKPVSPDRIRIVDHGPHRDPRVAALP